MFFFFLLLSNLLCLFQLQQTLHTVIFSKFFSLIRIRIKKAAGSGSALKKTPLDQDPQKMNADPQP